MLAAPPPPPCFCSSPATHLPLFHPWLASPPPPAHGSLPLPATLPPVACFPRTESFPPWLIYPMCKPPPIAHLPLPLFCGLAPHGSSPHSSPPPPTPPGPHSPACSWHAGQPIPAGLPCSYKPAVICCLPQPSLPGGPSSGKRRQQVRPPPPFFFLFLLAQRAPEGPPNCWR